MSAHLAVHLHGFNYFGMVAMSKMVLSKTLTFEIADYQALLVNCQLSIHSILNRYESCVVH